MNSELSPKAKPMKKVELIKGEHRFVFKYEEGQEMKAIEAITEMIDVAGLDFTTYDAAMLTNQVGAHHKAA